MVKIFYTFFSSSSWLLLLACLHRAKREWVLARARWPNCTGSETTYRSIADTEDIVWKKIVEIRKSSSLCYIFFVVVMLFFCSISVLFLFHFYGWFWLSMLLSSNCFHLLCARRNGIVIESPHDCDNSCTELVAYLNKTLRCIRFDMHVVASVLSFQSHHTELVRILCFHLCKTTPTIAC